MVKKIVSYILIFILIILLTSSIILAVASETLLNEEFVLKRLEKDDYYSKSYGIILEEFKNNTIQAGLDEEILDNVISKQQVKKDIKALVNYIYNGTEFLTDVEGIRSNLKERINNVIAENNKKVNQDEQRSIEIYVEKIANIYNSKINFSAEYIKPVREIFTEVEKIVNIVKPISYIVAIVVGLIIILINREESLKYLNIAITASGMLLIVPKIFEKITIDAQNILIINKTASETIMRAIDSAITTLLTLGIVLVIVGIILSIIECKKNKNYQE